MDDGSCWGPVGWAYGRAEGGAELLDMGGWCFSLFAVVGLVVMG